MTTDQHTKRNNERNLFFEEMVLRFLAARSAPANTVPEGDSPRSLLTLNGIYLNGRRVPTVDITDGQQIHLGNPDGPLLTFDVGQHQGTVGRPPATTAIRAPGRPAVAPPPTRITPRRSPASSRTASTPASACASAASAC